MEERNYISNLKGLLIILVVVGHFAQILIGVFSDELKFIPQASVLFIYSFHMPLFVFVSGYLSKNIEKRRDRVLIDTLLPYLIFQLTIGVAKAVLMNDMSTFSNLFYPEFGLWYLISLLIWRTFLPNLLKIKYIFVVAVIMNLTTCLFTGMDNNLALQRTVGFLVYFLLGYYAKFEIIEDIKKKFHKIISLCGTLILFLSFLIISNRFSIYSVCMKTFLHEAYVSDYSNSMLAFVYQTIALIIVVFMSLFVLTFISDKKNLLSAIGADTMPLYLSHLIIYYAVVAITSKTSSVVSAVIVVVACLMCITLFSSKIYRRVFNCIFRKLNAFVFKSEKGA